MNRISKILLLSLVFMALIVPARVQTTMAQSSPMTFAVIGDYARGGPEETQVANLVKSWNPAFVVTTGDDYYTPAGGSGSTKYDNSTGKDYCPFLGGITTSGTNCPQPGGSPVNRFFPSLGNHDYSDAGVTNNLPTTYLNYFNLPGSGIASTGTSGNERYYDIVQGPVHLFLINSNNSAGQEPDGTTSSSKQATWLKNQLAASTTPWQIVVFHHAPYTSGNHGNSNWMQWPFADWGADVVVTGHSHHYERISRNGIVYFVNGTGGGVLTSCGSPVTGSQYCESTFGAQRVTATDTSLDFEFISANGQVRDNHHIGGAAQPTPQPTIQPTGQPTAQPTLQPTITPTNPPSTGSIHVGDLDRSSVIYSGTWVAKVTITVHNDTHQPAQGVIVTAKWDLGGTQTCTTGTSGTCLIKKTKIPKSTSSATLTITKLTKDGNAFAAVSNHDADGDSNGTMIKVNKK